MTGDNNKWLFQEVGVSFNGNLLLLHSLNKGGLSAGSSPVQLVSQKHIGEDRPGNKSRAAVRLIEIEAKLFNAEQH